MAVPLDWTPHIQGIAAGAQQAMPGIQAAMPGDEIIEKYLNDYIANHQKGMPKEENMNSLLSQLQAQGQQMPNTQVSNVGLDNGQPALSPPGAQQAPMNAPVSTGPNSFALPPKVTNNTSLVGAAPQSSPQAPMPPPSQGIAANAAPIGPPMPSAAPPMSNPAPAIGADNTGEKVVSMPTAPINLLKQPTSTPESAISPPAETIERPPPPMRNRGQQERAMSAIERIETMAAKSGNLEAKQMKLQFDIIKEMKRNERITDKDIQDLKLRTAGLELKAQIAVTEMWLENKNNEAKNKIRKQNADTAARRTKGTEKMPPKLKQLWDEYKHHDAAVAKYDNTMTSRKNPEEVKRLKRLRLDAWNKYNLQAIEEEWDTTTMETTDKPRPEDFREPTGEGFNESEE